MSSWLPVCVVCFVIGAVVAVSAHQSPDQSQLPVQFIVGSLIAVVPIGIWLLVQVWRTFSSDLGRELRVASQNVPSPAEISVQLESEWGRPPSVEEVTAVQQMLHNRRNEALVNSGVTLGALYFMQRGNRRS